MNKFCTKCGHKLDKKTGKCPNCDKTIKKHRKLKIIASIMIVIFFIIVLFSTLNYFGIEIPIIDKFIKNNKMFDYAPSVERTLQETDTSKFTFYSSSEENIVTDEEQGLTFVNNEIIVTITSSEKKAELDKFVSTMNGEIVGEIPELSNYQILFNKEYTLDELKQIVSDLNTKDWVISANLNYCFEFDKQYVPNDKKWSKLWSDIPDGLNWGVEAIDIQEAWDYKDSMNNKVNIGVIDNMFDVNH